MYKILSVLIVVLTLVVSCADNASEETKRVASFEIEGMVCEMGCGASLRKGLYTTNAVDEVEVDYLEDRKMNVIHVHYSSGTTSPDDMLKIIEELNEGQFKASLIEDKETDPSTNADQEESSSASLTDEVDGLEANTQSLSLPNLTELINSLIH